MSRLQEGVNAPGELGGAAGVLFGQRGAAARRAVGIEQDGTIVVDDEIELAIVESETPAFLPDLGGHRRRLAMDGVVRFHDRRRAAMPIAPPAVAEEDPGPQPIAALVLLG